MEGPAADALARLAAEFGRLRRGVEHEVSGMRLAVRNAREETQRDAATEQRARAEEITRLEQVIAALRYRVADLEPPSTAPKRAARRGDGVRLVVDDLRAVFEDSPSHIILALFPEDGSVHPTTGTLGAAPGAGAGAGVALYLCGNEAAGETCEEMYRSVVYPYAVAAYLDAQHLPSMYLSCGADADAETNARMQQAAATVLVDLSCGSTIGYQSLLLLTLFLARGRKVVVVNRQHMCHPETIAAAAPVNNQLGPPASLTNRARIGELHDFAEALLDAYAPPPTRDTVVPSGSSIPDYLAAHHHWLIAPQDPVDTTRCRAWLPPPGPLGGDAVVLLRACFLSTLASRGHPVDTAGAAEHLRVLREAHALTESTRALPPLAREMAAAFRSALDTGLLDRVAYFI